MNKHLLSLLFIAFSQFFQAQEIEILPEVKILKEGFIYNNFPIPQCHSSTVVELENGTIMAAWFGGTHERHVDVSIYNAVFDGSTWTKPVKVADGLVDDTHRYPTWNPVLFKNKSGVLFLFYKVGPSPSDWWGMYKTSQDEGKTWTESKKLPKGILGPIKNKPFQFENGTIVSPSSTEDGAVWKVHMEISKDGGYHWEKVLVDQKSDFRAIQPTLLKLNEGSIKALIRSDQNVLLESESFDGGESWSHLKKTTVANPNSGIDAVTLKNGCHLLVYNPMVSGKDWWEGRNELKLAYSKDGDVWQNIYTLEEKEDGEYSYPAIIQMNNGNVFITYTHNRTKIKYVVLNLNSQKE